MHMIFTVSYSPYGPYPYGPYALLCNAQSVRVFVNIEKDYAIEILTSLNAKNFSLTSLDLQGFVYCDERGLTDFFEKHCSNLKLLALHRCWDTNENSGPFFKMLSRIGFTSFTVPQK